MESRVEQVGDEPIIVVSLEPHEDAEAEVKAVSQKVAAIADTIEARPVYRITDFSNIPITFNHILMGLAAETQGIPGTFSDPRLRSVLVGTSDMVKLGSTAAKQEQYGGIDILMFATLETALEAIRKEIATNTVE